MSPDSQNSDMPAIWPPYEAFYIESMLFNATSALNSALIVEECLKSLVSSKYSNECIAEIEHPMLDSLQNIVIQAGAISKYLWPPRDGKNAVHKRRGQFIQKSLNTDETSPLKNRDLRDTIEHFDEKLDLYLLNGVVGHILPSLISNNPINSEIPQHIFRAYYTKSGVFEILGNRFKIQPILDEVHRIYKILVEQSENGGRLQSKPLRPNP